MAKSRGAYAPESTVNMSRYTPYYDPDAVSWKMTSGSMPSNGISQSAYDAYAEGRASSPYNSYGSSGGSSSSSSSGQYYTAPTAQDLYIEQYRKQQEELLRQQQEALSGALGNAESAQRSRTDSAIAQIAAQQEGINRTADQSATQAYITREKALNAMPQQQAYLGLSGGASESALLGLNTGYENSRNAITQQRDDQIQNNINYQNQIRMEGDAALSDIQNAYAMQDLGLLQQQSQQEGQYATMLYEAAERQRQWEQQQAAEASRYDRERQDYLSDLTSQREWEQQQTEAERAYSRALAAQKASQSQTTDSMTTQQTASSYLSAYGATGDPAYLDAYNQLLGLSVGAVSSSASSSVSPYSSAARTSYGTREIQNAYSTMSEAGFMSWLRDAASKGMVSESTYSEWVNRLR